MVKPYQLGLSTTWAADDAEEVRAFNRRYSAKLTGKDRLDAMWQMYLDGYSAVDIGITFGISRERARQLLKKIGVRTDGAHLRMWSDKLSMFVPCSPKQYRAKRDAYRRASREAEVSDRFDEMAGRLRKFVGRHGYIPGSEEFARHITGRDENAIAVFVNRIKDHNKNSAAETMAEVYARAGIAHPSYGRLGIDQQETMGLVEAAGAVGIPVSSLAQYAAHGQVPFTLSPLGLKRFDITDLREALEKKAA